jgi:membrane protein YqaA with SNARE-associated domain
VLIVFLSACVYSAAVRGDPRRTRDPDVGHLVWRRRPPRADAAVSGDSLRCLRFSTESSIWSDDVLLVGVGVNWRLLIEFVVAIGYGVLSSVVPIFNAEIYIVASQVGGFTEEVTTAVGCAVGQTIGKVGIVLALRRGGSSRLVRKVRERPRKPAGSVRTKLRAWSDRMMGLLGERRWGVPIVLLSACVGLPPLYAVTLAVPATRMSVILFGAAVLLGRMVLFLAIAFGVSALFH